MAYEVLYNVQPIAPGFVLVDEQEAIENHRRYAPKSPGWRSWRGE